MAAMPTEKKIVAALLTSPLVFGPALLYAFAVKTPPRHTGGPGDLTCARADCHGGTPNSSGGRVAIIFPGGPAYLPGVKQTWTVVVSDPSARVFGFQLSARLASNPQFGRAGTVAPLDANTLVLCEDGSERPATGSCPASSVEFIEHSEAGLSRRLNEYTFRWTPPENAAGDVQVYVAALGANGDRLATGDRTYTATYTMRPAAITGTPSIRSARPVLQAFDDSERMSSGTWIQLYGDNLAYTTRSWNAGDFDGTAAPIELDGVRVNVNGKPGFVSFVSPHQVNVQAPEDADVGPVRVEVVNLAGISNGAIVQKAKVTPALQSNAAFAAGGKQYLVAFHPNFQSYVGPTGLIPGVSFQPARPGDVITAFAVGSGPTGVPPGRVPGAAASLQLPYQIRIGGVDATALGLQPPSFIGLYQFNVIVPNLPPGDHAVELLVDGVSTVQTLYTTIAP